MTRRVRADIPYVTAVLGFMTAVCVIAIIAVDRDVIEPTTSDPMATAALTVAATLYAIYIVLFAEVFAH